MNQQQKYAYLLPFTLILSIVLGGLTGYLSKDAIPYLRPIGDIFLNLIFTMIVPFIFFSVSSAITRINQGSQLKKIFFATATVFLFTSAIASLLAILVVYFFPPASDIVMTTLANTPKPVEGGFLNQIANIFTVSEFSKLLSHEHILSLIVFSILVGLGASRSLREEQQTFISFLNEGEKIFTYVFALIMRFAPFGFFAYFAVLVNELGTEFIHSYARVSVTYYVFALLYFIIIYTLYAYVALKKVGVCLFWKNIFLPATTAIATCSSAASIPATIVATKAMRAPTEIVEAVIPIGNMIHKDGSVIGGIFKIAFLFGLFHIKFAGLSTLLMAFGLSILVGTVMGAIPSGGMLGELLILTAYGIPASSLILIAAISIIIDPIATMLNVTGNSAGAMLISRLVNGKPEKCLTLTTDHV